MSHPHLSERCSSVPEAMTNWAMIPRDQTSGLLGHAPRSWVPGDKGLNGELGMGRREEFSPSPPNNWVMSNL